MADGRFRVALVTPESTLLEGEATAVVLRSADGDLTVLDGHTPLVTDVTPGEVRIQREEGTVAVAVHGGYLQVETKPSSDDGAAAGTRVTLLAGVAELADQIDVPRAQAARDAAEARLEERRAGGRSAPGDRSDTGEDRASPDDLEVRQAEAALRRAEVRLTVAGARVEA